MGRATRIGSRHREVRFEIFLSKNSVEDKLACESVEYQRSKTQTPDDLGQSTPPSPCVLSAHEEKVDMSIQDEKKEGDEEEQEAEPDSETDAVDVVLAQLAAFRFIDPPGAHERTTPSQLTKRSRRRGGGSSTSGRSQRSPVTKEEFKDDSELEAAGDDRMDDEEEKGHVEVPRLLPRIAPPTSRPLSFSSQHTFEAHVVEEPVQPDLMCAHCDLERECYCAECDLFFCLAHYSYSHQRALMKTPQHSANKSQGTLSHPPLRER